MEGMRRYEALKDIIQGCREKLIVVWFCQLGPAGPPAGLGMGRVTESGSTGVLS